MVENAFGILALIWRCLLTTLQKGPRKATKVVKATLALHILLRKRLPGLQANEVDHDDDDGNVVPGAWRQGVQLADPLAVGGQRVTREGKRLRNYLSDYLNSPTGNLPWRDRIV